MNEKELLDLKDEINEAKSEVSKLEGRKEHLLQQLEEEFGCKDLKQAKKKLSDLKEDIEELDEKIETEVEKLQEQYEL